MQILQELEILIPPLTSEEFKQLERNILEEGIRDPLVTWNGILVDGHNRYRIAQEHDMNYVTVEKEFADMNAVKEWMINNQFGRRNLNNYQRSVLALQLEEVFKEKAKENLKLSDGKGKQKSAEVKVEPIETRKELAKVANVSHDTIAKVKVIEQKAPEEIKAKLSTGEVSINQVYQEIKKEEKKIEQREKVIKERVDVFISKNTKQGDSLQILQELKDECIDIVLTDPPYGINYVSNRSIYEDTITKRGLLNDGKIDAFDLLDKTCQILLNKTAKNAHLYFFCSWSVFSSFEAIISKYFTIKTPIIWDKGNKGSGDLENDWGNQTEIILFCVKGKKLINKRRGNIISVPRLHTSKMIHPTQKPVELLKEILEVSYLENDFIVDPFMGSGSTIKACQDINAKCLGVELDEEMFQIANNIINE